MSVQGYDGQDSQESNDQAAMDALKRAKPVQMTFTTPGFWPPQVHAVPTGFTKTNIFSAGLERRKGSREISQENYVSDLQMFSASRGLAIYFSGYQLDQTDCDVWMKIIRMAKDKNLTNFSFTVHSFVKDLGLSIGSSSYHTVKRSLERLNKSSVKYVTSLRNPDGSIAKGKNEEIGLSLLPYYKINDLTGDIEVGIQGGVENLFKNVSWSEYQKRAKLRLQTSKALEFYAIGNRRGERQTATLEFLATYCGWSTDTKQNRYAFKLKIRKALDELVSAGIFASWEEQENQFTWVLSKVDGKDQDSSVLVAESLQEAAAQLRQPELIIDHDPIPEDLKSVLKNIGFNSNDFILERIQKYGIQAVLTASHKFLAGISNRDKIKNLAGLYRTQIDTLILNQVSEKVAEQEKVIHARKAKAENVDLAKDREALNQQVELYIQEHYDELALSVRQQFPSLKEVDAMIRIEARLRVRGE
ncbi:MAG: hypothetical protein RL095_451 [Verrucomicrobiota bacterium]|jgi:hypothetical protein